MPQQTRILLLSLSLTFTAVFAQSGGTGAIQGVVSDASGGVIPGATVSATNLATNSKTIRKTSAAGLYVLNALTWPLHS